MISKKTFYPDGTINRFLSDFIIRNEQYARPYVYIYDSGLDPDGSEDQLQDTSTDQADYVYPTNIWKRGTDTAQSNDLVPVDNWAVVDNSILYYSNPPNLSTVWLEVATTGEEFGTTLTQPSVERAETAADEAVASAAAALVSENNAAASEAAIDPTNLLHTVGDGGGNPEGYTATEVDTNIYTKTELDAGQLDNRYYTETEADLMFVPTGAIIAFEGTTAPSGFLEMDNSEVSETTYAALFAIVGTKYNTFDGAAAPAGGNFRLPPSQSADGRGLYIRGEGSVNGAVGSYEQDVYEEHRHFTLSSTEYASGSPSLVTSANQGSRKSNYSGSSQDASISGVSNAADVARSSLTGDTTETRPITVTKLYCIRY